MRQLAPLVLCMAAFGCGEATCEVLDTDCGPLYAPTFDEVHRNTLQTSCGLGGGSCHSSEGAAAGLVLDGGADDAYGNLVDRGLLDLEAPECSHLLDRMDPVNPGNSMPPGAMLGEAERCAIRQWVAAGALR